MTARRSSSVNVLAYNCARSGRVSAHVRYLSAQASNTSRTLASCGCCLTIASNCAFRAAFTVASEWSTTSNVSASAKRVADGEGVAFMDAELGAAIRVVSVWAERTAGATALTSARAKATRIPSGIGYGVARDMRRGGGYQRVHRDSERTAGRLQDPRRGLSRAGTAGIDQANGEPALGIEPRTARLRIECSTTELRWRHALARTRTATPFGTTPSRWRVYQFHHQGSMRDTCLTGLTGLEPATSGVTDRHSN